MKKSLLLMFIGTMAFLSGRIVANLETSGRTNSPLHSKLIIFSYCENDFAEMYQQAKQKQDESNRIGIIDKLMITQFIQENGKEILLKKIDKHFFEEKRESTDPSDHSKQIDMIFHPFCIVYRLQDGDESLLAKEVFRAIYTHEFLEIARMTENPLNQYNNFKNIDECSSYEHYILEMYPSVMVTEVTACFYNKEALLKAIEEL